ncbi:hypothetical protein ACHMW4_19790 [Mesorhizobium sp. UC22_110]|uniref:hypothetical protein n=1 Tax=Mesorhizobium sp. UC22_110 TaxID=3374552 RepID=UPI0037578809
MPSTSRCFSRAPWPSSRYWYRRAFRPDFGLAPGGENSVSSAGDTFDRTMSRSALRGTLKVISTIREGSRV